MSTVAQALKNCVPDTDQVRSGAQNLWGLPCKKERFIWSTNCQSIDKAMKKLQWIWNTIVEHQCTSKFDVYIFDDVKTDLPNQGLRKI